MKSRYPFYSLIFRFRNAPSHLLCFSRGRCVRDRYTVRIRTRKKMLEGGAGKRHRAIWHRTCRMELFRARSLLCQETGKSINSARAEMSRVGLMARGYAERATHLYGDCLSDAQPGMERDVIFTRREPLGIVVCVVPFNHPVSLYTQKVAPLYTESRPGFGHG